MTEKWFKDSKSWKWEIYVKGKKVSKDQFTKYEEHTSVCANEKIETYGDVGQEQLTLYCRLDKENNNNNILLAQKNSRILVTPMADKGQQFYLTLYNIVLTRKTL